MEAPIPPPRLDDDEDVHWALSTAGALWGRGERTEALKWLRRAAEQASDVNADKRALELFKAAAEMANQVNGASAPPPPAPPAPPTPPPAEVAPRAPGPPPVPQRASIPPRSGSVFPPPPAPLARPPSIPAPAVPRAPMTSAAHGRVGPPPAPPSAPRQTPPPARPAVPVTPPAQPVAISAAKPVPQAIAPKRRRSFTGEARPEKARPADGSRARHIGTDGHKPRRRTHTDDDLHLAARPAEAPAAATGGSSIWDDLDEDTRVISGKARGGDELEQALSRLRAAPAPPPPEPTRRNVDHPAAGPRAGVDHPAAGFLQDELTSGGERARAREPGNNGPQSTTAPGNSPATERPSTDAGPDPAAHRRLDTLPAVRVAVLGTGLAGEVRLISLDGGDEPPPGAAVAILVPMSAADGEAIARLFGALE